MSARAQRIGLVFACGGLVGYAWSLLALRRYARATGWDPRRASALVGTSAGSILATELGAGASVDDLFARLEGDLSSGRSPSSVPPAPAARWPSLPLLGHALDRGSSVSLRTALSGLVPEGRADSAMIAGAVDRLVPEGAWVEHPSCWVVALDVETGERVAFGRAGAPHASSRQAVRASCAIPGWCAPVSISGRRYLDGGIASPTSADLLADEDLDEIVVFSPMTSVRPAPAHSFAERLERVMRWSMTSILDDEVERLTTRGHRVTRYEPTAYELGLMGGNFMDARKRAALVAAWSE
ncbi:MAG: patatin-like phospholipase family protein [Polyangiaceae bacterium]